VESELGRFPKGIRQCEDLGAPRVDSCFQAGFR